MPLSAPSPPRPAGAICAPRSQRGGGGAWRRGWQTHCAEARVAASWELGLARIRAEVGICGGQPSQVRPQLSALEVCKDVVRKHGLEQRLQPVTQRGGQGMGVTRRAHALRSQASLPPPRTRRQTYSTSSRTTCALQSSLA